VSESGTGKTFVMLDMGGAVSDGVRWHGRDVQHGSVLYVGFEGDAMGLRVRAVRDIAGRRCEDFYLIRASDPLSPRVDRDGETRSFGEIALTAAIDTLVAELASNKRPPSAPR
jgi:hypothetical protein